MQHWSKRVGIVLFACLMLLLCACGSRSAIYARTQYYTVYTRNGQWFMEFHPKRWRGNASGDSLANIAVSYPEFRSLSDMQNRIQSGNIEPFDLTGLYSQSKDNVLQICDLNNLLDLVTPDDLAYSGVRLWGNSYEFYFEEDGINGYIYCVDQDRYEQAFNEDYTDCIEDRFILADTTTEDGNTRIVYSRHYSSTFRDKLYRDIFYHIQVGAQTLYIRESRTLEYFPEVHTEAALKGLDISATVPQEVCIFGNDGTNYFYGQLEGFDARPSVQWLSGFGLKPHSEGKPAIIGLSIGVVVGGLILVAAGYREKRRRRLASEDRTIR